MAEVKEKFIRMPTYLKALLKSDDYINLVYKMRTTEPILDNLETTLPLIEITSTLLDLTGCPLETDLKENDSMNSTTIIEKMLDNWTEEESFYIPIGNRDTACSFLNQYNKPKYQNGNSVRKNTPIFCICDGTTNGIVLMGTKTEQFEFNSFCVYAKGLFPTSSPCMHIDSMKKEHITEINRSHCKIDSKIECSYSIYGHRYQEGCNKFNQLGSILMELKWNTLTYDIPEIISSLQLMLQVVVGHKDSPIFPLWNQILLLKYYIDLLENLGPVELNKSAENTNISVAPRSISEIRDKVNAILSEVKSLRSKGPKAKEDVENFDMKNLRDESSLDKLYSLFCYCATTKDLAACFNFLFNEVAQNNQVKIYIPDENTTITGKIIRDIRKGICGVPTLTPKQALEFYIELGFDKLKQDYFFILNSYIDPQYLEVNWDRSKYNEHVTQKGTKKTGSSKQSKVRMSVFPPQVFITCKESKMKLNVLTKMHSIAEFLFMIKKNNMNNIFDDTLQQIVNCAKDKFLIDSPEMDFSLVEEKKLIELDVTLPVNAVDYKKFTKKRLSSWRLEMSTASADERSSVKTIFLHTSYPIFPLGIFNKFDYPLDTEDYLYFVTKLVERHESFK